MSFVLGLTGSIGSGKTLVADMFRELGAAVISADDLARAAVEPGRPALAEIAAAFGAEMLDGEGRLRRAALAARVFADRRALARLNGIVHPHVAAQARHLMSELDGVPLIVYDVPLLLEAGRETRVDKVAVVTVSENQRFLRLRRRGLTEREIVARLGMQMPQSEKIRHADTVIDNSGTIEATRKQVQTLLDTLTREKHKEHEYQKP